MCVVFTLMRFVQNKKKKECVWRGSEKDTEDGLGQLMLYLTTAHFSTMSKTKTKPSPILGVYMKDLKVCFL